MLFFVVVLDQARSRRRAQGARSPPKILTFKCMLTKQMVEDPLILWLNSQLMVKRI